MHATFHASPRPRTQRAVHRLESAQCTRASSSHRGSVMLRSSMMSVPSHTTHAVRPVTNVVLSRAGSIASRSHIPGIVVSEQSSSSSSGTCSTSAPPTSLATLRARCGVPTATDAAARRSAATSLRPRRGAIAATAAINAARTQSIIAPTGESRRRNPESKSQNPNPESRLQACGGAWAHAQLKST